MNNLKTVIYLSLLLPLSLQADDFVFKQITPSLCVSTDVYKVNGVRTPVDLKKALLIAKQNNARLPTVDEVYKIWLHADVRLTPIPMKPPGDYNQHDKKIGHFKKGLIIAGHKKTLVSPHKKGRVAIYGWIRKNGKPIQPYSNVHVWNYKDYSHGLRLVKKKC